MIHAIKPLMFKATKFHCLRDDVCTITHTKPIIKNIGLIVHCPAITKPAPMYPTRDANFCQDVSLFV